MSQAPRVQEILENASTSFQVGGRDFSERKANLIGKAAFVLGLGLMASTAMGDAQAQSWTSWTETRQTSSDQVGRNETLRQSRGELMEVIQVRPVQIVNDSRVTGGGVFGAALGAAAGRQVENRDARRLAQIAGAGLGGAIGQGIHRNRTQQDGVEIMMASQPNRRGEVEIQVVRQSIEDGEAVPQPGDRVLVTRERGGLSRVIVLQNQRPTAQLQNVAPAETYAAEKPEVEQLPEESFDRSAYRRFNR